MFRCAPLEDSVKVATTRFGDLQVDEKDILDFKEGILGFETLTRFFIVDPGDNTLIMWMQSIEDGSVAFPVIEPKIFNAEYIVKLLPAELRSLQLENLNAAKIFSILTIPQDVTQMSANLKAPIVINSNTGFARQIVLQDNKLSVRYEMYKELKRHIIAMSNNASDDSNRTSVNLKAPTVQSTIKPAQEEKLKRPSTRLEA